MNQQSPTETLNAIQKELIEAYAARAQADEKILALRNVLQGAALGVELQKAVEAEAKTPEQQ